MSQPHKLLPLHSPSLASAAHSLVYCCLPFLKSPSAPPHSGSFYCKSQVTQGAWNKDAYGLELERSQDLRQRKGPAHILCGDSHGPSTCLSLSAAPTQQDLTRLWWWSGQAGQCQLRGDSCYSHLWLEKWNSTLFGGFCQNGGVAGGSEVSGHFAVLWPGRKWNWPCLESNS